jgi:hypothetical protein
MFSNFGKKVMLIFSIMEIKLLNLCSNANILLALSKETVYFMLEASAKGVADLSVTSFEM